MGLPPPRLGLGGPPLQLRAHRLLPLGGVLREDLGGDLVGFHDLADLDLTVLEGHARGPLDRLLPRLHLDQPEARDQLLRLGEGPVDHRRLAGPGEPDARALRARMEAVGGQQHAGLQELLVEPAHLGDELPAREAARLALRVRLDQHHESHRVSPRGSLEGSGGGAAEGVRRPAGSTYASNEARRDRHPRDAVSYPSLRPPAEEGALGSRGPVVSATWARVSAAVPAPARLLPRWAPLVWAVGLGAVACLAVANTDGMHLDEALYAYYGRHVSQGDLLLIHVMPPLDKPPVFFWMIGATIPALGDTPLTIRLPNLAASLATVACTYVIARDLAGRAAGALAATLVAASPF